MSNRRAVDLEWGAEVSCPGISRLELGLPTTRVLLSGSWLLVLVLEMFDHTLLSPLTSILSSSMSKGLVGEHLHKIAVQAVELLHQT